MRSATHVDEELQVAFRDGRENRERSADRLHNANKSGGGERREYSNLTLRTISLSPRAFEIRSFLTATEVSSPGLSRQRAYIAWPGSGLPWSPRLVME